MGNKSHGYRGEYMSRRGVRGEIYIRGRPMDDM